MLVIDEREAYVIFGLMGVAELERGLSDREKALREHIFEEMPRVKAKIQADELYWNLRDCIDKDPRFNKAVHAVELINKRLRGCPSDKEDSLWQEHERRTRALQQVKEEITDRLLCTGSDGWVF